MGVMGEKRRDGQLQIDQKVPKKTARKCEKRASAIVVSKEIVPVVLKLRLFVGGLGPTVGASDLEQRFSPLGTVHRIDLVEGKQGWDAEEALQRGFAYVDFEASSEASLRKLFSAYNGCKWKGGVLRVEKAKEHYVDRLRREWTEAEAEAVAKARIAENAEKAAANAIIPSRPMYSSKREDAWGSPECDSVVLDEVIEEDVDGDEIAAQIEKERKKQLDLLTKLFPEDKDAGDEEEKVIEIAKLRAFPMPTDVSSKKRKHILETSPALLASSSVQPIEEECRGASVPDSSDHVSGPMDVNDRQKAKSQRVNLSGEALTAAVTASKWAEMFKSASSVTEPVEGLFSGLLNEFDVAVSPRAAVEVPKMFESVVANHTGSLTEAPMVLDPSVSSDVMEDASRPSPEKENSSTNSDALSNQDVAKVEKDDITELSKEVENVDYYQQAVVVHDNMKWMQRATWKSLMDADGRATFSLKQLTGESETTKAAVPEKSFSAFSFKFSRNLPEASEVDSKSISTGRPEGMPKPDSAVEEKTSKTAKISEDEPGCSFMKSANAEKEWRASKSELRIDARAKHKSAVRKMKKMKGSGGAR